MQNLPEHVPDTEIHEMFSIADVDKDGQISYEEFMVCSLICQTRILINCIVGHDKSTRASTSLSEAEFVLVVKM